MSVPVLLALAGLWLMAGCFYLPLPEHLADRQTKDFRNLLGPSTSNKPIRPGGITRAQVIELLGPAPFASDALPAASDGSPSPIRSADHSGIGYIVETEYGTWFYPLCFKARADKTTQYELRLVFDKNDVLDHWDLVKNDDITGHNGVWSYGIPFPPFQDGAPKLFAVPRGEKPRFSPFRRGPL